MPVTGGQDSFYILHIVKNILGLNPLLVNYNKYYNTPLGIHNLSNLRIKFDCDIIFKNVNPISVRKITKATLDKFGSVYWHCLAGHSVFPVQVSAKMKIPLIIWGSIKVCNKLVCFLICMKLKCQGDIEKTMI